MNNEIRDGIRLSQPIKIDHEVEVMKTLKGKFKHYCVEWDSMAIDETSPEFDACMCFDEGDL